MANPAHIFPALRKAYLAAITDADTLTSFPNEAFDPKGKPVWYQFTFIPNTPDVFTLGQGGLDAHDGILQIDINIENGKGVTGIEEFTAALSSTFTAGARFMHDTAVVRILSCGQSGPGNKVDSYYRLSFRIQWEAFSQR